MQGASCARMRCGAGFTQGASCVRDVPQKAGWLHSLVSGSYWVPSSPATQKTDRYVTGQKTDKLLFDCVYIWDTPHGATLTLKNATSNAPNVTQNQTCSRRIPDASSVNPARREHNNLCVPAKLFPPTGMTRRRGVQNTNYRSLRLFSHWILCVLRHCATWQATTRRPLTCAGTQCTTHWACETCRSRRSLPSSLATQRPRDTHFRKRGPMRQGVVTSVTRSRLFGLTSKIPPLGSTRNFDADVKRMTTRHQCEKRLTPAV